MMKRLLLILSLLFLSPYLEANTNRFFNRITISNGLASNNVYSIWQDKKGYMWVGTSNGLQRFDGKNFLNFNVKKTTFLPAKPVRQILEDREGNMWMTYGDEYGIYNPANSSFNQFPFEKEENRFKGERLWIDSKGNVYIILVRNKLLHFDREKKIFTENNLPIKLPEGFQPNSIFEDSKTGYYWISGEQGLAVYDPKKEETYYRGHNPLHLPNIDNPEISTVTNYHIDRHRNHWTVYWNPDQLFKSFSEKSKQYTTEASSLVNITPDYKEMHGSMETKSGEFWYYGVNSLYVYNPSKKYFDYLKHEFLKYSQIYQIYEDREGNLWLTSDEGIYHYSDNAPDISYGFYPEGNPKHLFLDIKQIQLKNGKSNYWIPSWGRGIVILDDEFTELPSAEIYKNAPKKTEIMQPWVLLQEKTSGLIWVGIQRGWIQIIDPNTLKTAYYHFPVFSNSTIRSISQDRDQHIWFTTQRGDLIKFEHGKPLENDSFKLIRSFKSFAFAHLVDQQKRVWVCTSQSGVYCLDADSGEELKHLNSSILSSNIQEKIVQLNDSIFFFGYDLLNAYNANSGENRILSYSEGMISNDILHMQADLDGFLWIYTPKGICRYNYFQNSFTHYGHKDGFGLMELDGTAGTLTNDGRIIFAGYSSLTAFKPTQFNGSIKPDRPVLTNIKLFDNYLYVDSLNTEEKRTFSHDNNALTFYFSTLSFTNQDKLKYFYKLSDIDPDWRSGGQTNMAVYSLLPPGGYTLEFRSENEEGISSPIGSFVFRITPPFYETWWFKTIIGLLVIGILTLMYRLHINRILAVVNVRNRVARDLHDDMGSTLSTINILSTMAKTKLHTDPVKTSDYITKISDNSQRMMEAMDDIVWSIKPQNDSMEKVIARMREFATNAMEAKDIDFRFEVEEEVYGVKLPMDTRKDLFLVFKEAVNNMAKYSKCSRAFIHFSIKKINCTCVSGITDRVLIWRKRTVETV